MHERIRVRIERQTALIGRPLTQPETDCFVESTTRHLYHDVFGIPIGTLGGAIRSYQVVSKDPNYKTHFKSFIEAPTWPSFVQGVKNYNAADQAEFRRAVLRGGLRLAWWIILGEFIWFQWMNVKDMIRITKDDRMKEFWVDFKKAAAQSSRGNMKGQQREGEEQGQGQGQGQNMGLGSGSGSGSGSDEEASRFGASTTTWGRGEEEEKKVEEQRPRPRWFGRDGAGAGPAAAAPAPAPVSGDNKGGSFWDEDDDASPVASEYRDDSVPGESAWDRIRRQNHVGASQQRTVFKPVQPQSSNPAPDSDNGRSSEREQAQAEFDKMLDNERKMSTDGFQSTQQKNGAWWGKWN